VCRACVWVQMWLALEMVEGAWYSVPLPGTLRCFVRVAVGD